MKIISNLNLTKRKNHFNIFGHRSDQLGGVQFAGEEFVVDAPNQEHVLPLHCRRTSAQSRPVVGVHLRNRPPPFTRPPFDPQYLQTHKQVGGIA